MGGLKWYKIIRRLRVSGSGIQRGHQADDKCCLVPAEISKTASYL